MMTLDRWTLSPVTGMTVRLAKGDDTETLGYVTYLHTFGMPRVDVKWVDGTRSVQQLSDLIPVAADVEFPGPTYTDTIRRNVRTENEYVGLVTVRRSWEDGVFLGATIYLAGWKQTTVKTERGIASAVARLTR